MRSFLNQEQWNKSIMLNKNLELIEEGERILQKWK